MAAGPHTFSTMVVFTAEKFQGNPLAVVAVRGNALTQQRKSLIAKEFRYSETVFIHDAPGPGMPRRLEIFTETGEEIPFAGHPIIGAMHYVCTNIERLEYRGPEDRDTQRQTTVFLTKAGRVSAFYNPYRQVAACSIPHAYHLHSKELPLEKILTVQPQVQIVPTVDKCRGKTFPVVSIVKGMTFGLVDLTDAPEVFAALQAGQAPEVELDTEWSPSFVGCMYYIRKQRMEQAGEPTIHNIQARMISHGSEDPGTGSGCSALACYLALTQAPEKSVPAEAKPAEGQEGLADKLETVKLEDKSQRVVFGIQQGVEMGRLCTIAVEVDVRRDQDDKPVLAGVILSGRANFQTKGEIVGS